MRNPETLSGRVWLDRHYEHLKTWLLGGRADAEEVREAARALQFLLEREPGYARETRQLAVHLAMSTWMYGVPDVVDEVVRIGLDADVMAPELRAEPALSGLLLLCRAEAQLGEDQRLAGLQTLRGIPDRLAETAVDDALVQMVRGRARGLEGELEELDSERTRAEAAFAESRAALGALLLDEAATEEFSAQWTLQVFGPHDATISASAGGLADLGLMQLEQAYVAALLGLLRTHGDETDLVALADETANAVRRFGLGKWTHPLLTFPALVDLGPEGASELGEAFVDAAGRGSAAMIDRAATHNLPPELAQALESAAGGDDEPTRTAWQVAVQIAVAAALERAADERAAAAYQATVAQAMEARMAVPQAFAIGCYAAFLARQEGADPAAPLDMFLTTFDLAHRVDPEAFESLPLRGLFDDVVRELLAWQLAQPDALETPDERRRLSVLLDLLRARAMPSALQLAPADPFGRAAQLEDDDPLLDGVDAMSNTLDRVGDALRGTEGVVALIVQGDRARRVFLLVDGDGLSVHRADEAFDSAVEAVEEAAQLAAFLAGMGAGAAPEDPLLPAARAAFDALPEPVAAAIASAEVLLVAPEFHAGAGELPIELLHDGEDYVVASGVVARVTSLRHLARVLDTPQAPAAPARALVTAAPEGIPEAPLYTAGPECSAIAVALRDAGWDVPDTPPERLDAEYYADRLRHVAVVHVAAHGESGAGTEYLVLPGGRRFTVDTLLERPQPSLPLTYLNTCRLGRTRYLGGGQARGLAFTLSEMGAPAVLANTTDVLDASSTDIATGFYADALEQPVGWALHETRARMIEDGVHPALVARVILFGDPWHSMDPAHETGAGTSDAASELLDAFIGGSEAARPATWERAAALVMTGEADARVVAALALVRGLDEQHDGGGDPEARLARYAHAVDLADALAHAPARALLRLVRARAAEATGEPQLWRELLQDAIRHLEPLEHAEGPWGGILSDARAQLRTHALADRGITPRRMGPGADEPDPAMDAIVQALFATQQASEERHGAVRPRPIERTLEDIAFNAVVLGHPNRFEDTAEASTFCGLVARKLVLGGHLPEERETLARTMLLGLLWFLWSSQKTAYLEPELVTGQTGTVLALVDELASSWPPADAGEAVEEALRFEQRVDETLRHLDDQPWEGHHEEVERRVPALAVEAEGLLDGVAAASPAALAGCAALLTGTLAARNTYSPLDGQDDMHESMTRAVWTLSHRNEGRFLTWLWRGFEPIRTREGDELDRWRDEDAGRAMGAARD